MQSYSVLVTKVTQDKRLRIYSQARKVLDIYLNIKAQDLGRLATKCGANTQSTTSCWWSDGPEYAEINTSYYTTYGGR